MICYSNLIQAMFMQQHLINALPCCNWQIIRLEHPGRTPEFAVIHTKEI